MLKKENMESGVTLVALAVTIIVIIIIAGIATSAGVDNIRNSKRVAFITELEMIQEKVNTIYEKRKLNKEDITYYNTLGQDVSVIETGKLSEILKGNSEKGYRYFSKENLSKLDLENIEQDVMINFDTRDVASVDGFLIDGKMCYRLSDIPSYQGQNIEYVDKNVNNPTFDVDVTRLSDKWQVVIKNIENPNQVYGGTLSYKLQTSQNWILAGETVHFEVREPRNI